ncbi:MAG TPA: peroxidase-related enzyme [Silvibacterium sp.]|jgi:uncharacterized peroxidase-related enzyme|nr:peroxidase-related enzyme [Silvibacterium sp.]
MTRPEYTLLAELRPAPAAHVETKIPLIDEAEATGETAAAYQYFRDQMGRQDVPGILKCFGTNPAFVRQMIDISSTLLFADGYLTRRQKEMISAYISKLNACPYCLDSHGFFLLVHGAPKEVADKIIAGEIDDAALSDAERHLLLYVKKVNGESFKTTKEDVQQLRDLGWQDEQIAEAVHVAAMMGLCNRVANAFGLPSQGFLELKR